MKKVAIIVTASLFSMLAIFPAGAQVKVGVNVCDANKMDEPKRDEVISALLKHHVGMVRCGLTEESLPFIVQATTRGIGIVAILDPTKGGSGEHARPADPARDYTWKQEALSDCKPREFGKFYSTLFASLDQTHTRLAAIECGNEINSANYNGDFPLQQTGRFLSLSDLHNREDAEAAAVASGFRNYVKVVEELKRLRDKTEANRTTPILSAGMATMGAARKDSKIKKDGVTNQATIAYMRECGLDGAIDGYGVHVYPSDNPDLPYKTVVARLEADTFAANAPGMGKKQIWITEWGFSNNSPECPLTHDETRRQVVQRERKAFKEFAAQGRLAAILWFSWSGHLAGEKKPGSSIFRCGKLTVAGRNALMTMDEDSRP